VVVHACNLSTQEYEPKDCEFEARPGYIARPCLRKKERKKEKRAGGMAQAVESLCSEALSSNLSNLPPLHTHTKKVRQEKENAI
jgi:hypothetical protein